MFQIGHEARSCTQDPNYHPIADGSNCFVIDCPGFGDTSIYAEFPNLTLIRQVVRSARKLAVCFIIKGSSLSANRGDGYVRVITQLVRILSQEGVENCKAILLPLINEAQGFRTQKALEKALNNPIEILEQKLDAVKKGDTTNEALTKFNGALYPQLDEIPAMLKLLKHCATDYKVISPMEIDK